MTHGRRGGSLRLGLAVLLLAPAALLGAAAVAAVQTRSAAGFVVVHELSLTGTPVRVYRALTDEVSGWWDGAHSYSGAAANFTLDARAGGCFCERLADGGSVEHMRVVFAAPGRLLRMAGGLGPLQGMGASGVMDFELSAREDGGTRLRFTYTVGGYVPDGLEGVAEPVDGVLGGQLARLEAYLKAVP